MKVRELGPSVRVSERVKALWESVSIVRELFELRVFVSLRESNSFITVLASLPISLCRR